MFERHLTFHIPALKYETLVLVLAALFLLIQTVLPFKDLDMAVARWTYTVGGGAGLRLLGGASMRTGQPKSFQR